MSKRHYEAIPSVQALQDFDQAFDRSFSLVAYVLNRHLIDHMLRAARLLTAGDTEMLIVWGVLAHQNVAHLMPPGSVPSAVLDDRGMLRDGGLDLAPLRLRTLAEITRIPRETVRRKLHALEAQGYVTRSSRGWVLSTERSDPELREFTRESVWRLLATADEIRNLLRASEQQRT
jgi:predicted transcriptional regulator